MSSKSERYTTNKSDTDSLYRLSEKLTQDLRKSIRLIGSCDILSPEWIEIAEIFERIAQVSDLESKLSSEKNDKTLWETEEQSLRFLLEDGKLNISLQSLIDFKMRQIFLNRNNDQTMNTIHCHKFEKGLGIVLRNAWNHIEALQTTNIPNLIRYCGEILSHIVIFPENHFIYFCDINNVNFQESLVFSYIDNIMHFVHDLGEQRVMPYIRECEIISALISTLFLNNDKNSITRSLVIKISCIIAQIFSTEDYLTNRKLYLHVPSIKSQFLNLLEDKKSSVHQYVNNEENRKVFRELSDESRRIKRLL